MAESSENAEPRPESTAADMLDTADEIERIAAAQGLDTSEMQALITAIRAEARRQS